jgi:hypothetical protein
MKVRVWVGKSKIAGKGVFTAQDIKKDTRIFQYVGERISKQESAKRIDEGNVYIFTFNGQYDGSSAGSVLRVMRRHTAPVVGGGPTAFGHTRSA